MSINPPSTADATINGGGGGLTSATTGRTVGLDDEDNGNGVMTSEQEEMLMNKSEFLLNELTGGGGVGDSQSPLTSSDIMAIMMMTMSNAATADQISLNGVSSSLATTALPTVLTPLYTDNDQYVVHQRGPHRRRHRSSSPGNKKYLRRRRKNGQQQQPRVVRKTKVSKINDEINQEGETTTAVDQNVDGENVKQLTTGEGDEATNNNNSNTTTTVADETTTAVVRKPKHRKRKRILAAAAAAITTTPSVFNDHQAGGEAATLNEGKLH